MAGKRTASSDLNHDNWDDYEPEEAGTFQKAPDEVLQKRIIKTARRRRPIGEESSTKNVFSNFSGFGKPAASTVESPFAFLANICSPSNSTQSKTNGVTTTALSSIPSTTVTSTPIITFKPSPAATPLFTSPQTTQTNSNDIKTLDNIKPSENGTTSFSTSLTNTKLQNSVSDNNVVDSKSTEYYSNLKGLNESVSQWIKTHVDKNPFCILTPIFRDYEKYLKQIESKKEEKETGSNVVSSIFSMKPSTTSSENNVTNNNTATNAGSNAKATTSATALPFTNSEIVTTVFNSTTSIVTSTVSAPVIFNNTPIPSIFGQSTTKPSETSIFAQNTPKPSETNIFGQTPSKPPEGSFFSPKPTTNFEKPSDKPEENAKSPFASNAKLTFGSSSNPFGSSSGFSFNSGTPFTFPNVVQQPSENKTEEEEDSKEEPPKAEFTPVVEEDHIYTKRCKVFVRKDGNYSDRGVGQLFLKPVAGSEKVQLIVRADTNLGNLLLNFILSNSIQMQRTGKNNVTMVCIPMPDAKPPPVPVLLRVKTAEEADELFKVLEKHKK